MIFFKKTLLILLTTITPHLWAIENHQDINRTLHSHHPIKIGILSFRPKSQTLAQWKPLETVLKKAIPEYDFKVTPLSYPELNDAAHNDEIDFVLTNPAHYILLRKTKSLSSPLATLAVNEHGKTTTVFGGVIFTRADESAINTLKDIPNKKIAITDTESMGGYQTQLYELKKAGVRLPNNKNLVITGMPHDNVVHAVLSHRADVGFVRSGILEDMLDEGKIDNKKIKILNRQNFAELPVALSTQLYPEWPLAALPNVDEKLARNVVAALFLLQKDDKIAHEMDIEGFSIPTDYTPVEDILRELRLPPFNTIHNITLNDILEHYRWQIILALLILSLIFILTIRLFGVKQKLALQYEKANNSLLALQRAERIAKIGNWSLDLITNKLHWSDEIFHIFELDKETFKASYEGFLDTVHPEDRDLVSTAYTNSLITKEQYHITHRLLMRDGRIKYVMEECENDFDEEGKVIRSVGTVQDITQQQLISLRNTYLLQIIDQYVLYTRVDKNGIIQEVSSSFCEHSGCIHEDIIGKNVNIFKSGHTAKSLYATLWETITAKQIFSCDIENRNFKKGTNWYHVTISPSYNEYNQHVGYIAFYEDIDDKIMFKKSSETDILTGLPNRAKIDDVLLQEIERSLRYKEPLSLILVDIDHFKEVNDQYGHQIGDLILQEFSTVLRNNIRTTDIVGRWGGEEFLIICTQTDTDGAYALAENLRMLIASFSFSTIDHKTASFGVASYSDNLPVNILFKNVDDALYTAKEEGRNRVIVFN